MPAFTSVQLAAHYSALETCLSPATGWTLERPTDSTGKEIDASGKGSDGADGIRFKLSPDHWAGGKGNHRKPFSSLFELLGLQEVTSICPTQKNVGSDQGDFISASFMRKDGTHKVLVEELNRLAEFFNGPKPANW
jgi:hypothetical protein